MEPIPGGEGAYLTDGKRLAQVVGLADDGVTFMLEDCNIPCGKEADLIKVDAESLRENWERVEPAREDRAVAA